MYRASVVCECAAHRASGVPVGQLGESTGEASAAARGLASWGRPWSGEGFTSLRRPSGALAAALAGLHPSVPGKVRRRRVFGAAPCTAGKLGARPHALTSPWGRNRGTKRPLGAELRCLGVQGDGNLFLTLAGVSVWDCLSAPVVCGSVPARLLGFHRLPHPQATVGIDVLWGKDGRKLLFHYFDDVAHCLLNRPLKESCERLSRNGGLVCSFSSINFFCFLYF